MYNWDFSAIWAYLPAFREAVWVTVQLAIYSSVLGTLAGIPLAVLLRLPSIVSWCFVFVVDILRGTPNLVLIFFFYYFPYSEILGTNAPSGFVTVLIALVAAQAAYTADLLRAAVDQVPRSQIQGLKALGFRRIAVVRYAVFPSIIRQVLPAHVALWIGNLKLTSLASVIGVKDVVYVAKVAMAVSFRSLEAWLIVALIYIILVLPFTYALRKFETSAWIRRQ